MSEIRKWLSLVWHGRGPSSPFYMPSGPVKPTIQFTSIASLSDALTRAKDAHTAYERGLGQADTNWPLWYAAHMAAEQGLLGKTECERGGTCGNGEKTESIKQVDTSTEETYWSAH